MSESPFPKIAHPQKRAFLVAFRETGNVCLACKVAGVGRQTHYDWMEVSAEYRGAFAAAQEDATDRQACTDADLSCMKRLVISAVRNASDSVQCT